MITAVVVTAALMLTPVADTPSPIKKGQKVHDSPISLYQGRYYVKADNKKRLCIRQKESRHDRGDGVDDTERTTSHRNTKSQSGSDRRDPARYTDEQVGSVLPVHGFLARMGSR